MLLLPLLLLLLHLLLLHDWRNAIRRCWRVLLLPLLRRRCYIAAAAGAEGGCSGRGAATQAQQRKELCQVAGARLVEAPSGSAAEPRRGGRASTQVHRLHHRRHPPRLHLRLHGRHQPLRELLLRLQPRRQALGDARKLGQAQHHALLRHVGDVAAPVEGQQAVLAQRGKGDVPHHHQAI